MKPKEELVEDERFIFWLKTTLPLYSVTELSRALGTTPADLKRIVRTGRIPVDTYKRCEEFGFVRQARELPEG